MAALMYPPPPGPPDSHGGGAEKDDPTELLLPHVDPEDLEELAEGAAPEAAVVERAADHENHSGGSSPPLNRQALAGLIAQQADSVGVDLLGHRDPNTISFPIGRIQEVRSHLVNLSSDKPQEAITALKALLEPLDARLADILEPGDSNLDRSCDLYLQLRTVFDKLQDTSKVLGEGLDWPIPGGNDGSLRTAGRDLEAFYRAQGVSLLAPRRPVAQGQCHSSLIVRHSVDGLFEELETLRTSTGGRVVNLHSDWRMWLAWLASGNPILCLGWMNEHLARPKGEKIEECSYDPAEIEPDRALRGFLVVGFKLYDGLDDFRQAIVEVANGFRPHRQLPIRYRLRNSWDPKWGSHGHAWIEHRDFAHQFGEGFGLLIPGTALAGG
jgi:hypothetical protein